MTRKNRPMLETKEIKEEKEKSYNYQFEYGTKNWLLFRCASKDENGKKCGRKMVVDPQSSAMTQIIERKLGNKTRKTLQLDFNAPKDILYERTLYKIDRMENEHTCLRDKMKTTKRISRQNSSQEIRIFFILIQNP